MAASFRSSPRAVVGVCITGAFAALVLACSAPAATPAPITNVPPATAAPGDEWIYRALATGLALPDSRVETYRLVRVDDRAVLTVTSAASREPHDLAVTHLVRWQPATVRTFRGAATAYGAGLGLDHPADAGGLRLDLAEDDGDTVWRWRCHLASYPVAPADAVVGPHPGLAGCGDAGRWSAPSQEVTALACTDAILDADLVAGVLVFGRAPGIELFSVHDDCLHASTLRHIAPDGAIGRVR